MKVLSLHAENVKKIKVVDITPVEDMVVISGKNAQGKTSVLDSIWLALGGAQAAKDMPQPIRIGEKEAKVVLDLGKYKVTRTWTEKGSYLRVETPEGARYPSPQALLDELRGAYTFDCLEFAKAKPQVQKEILLQITGLEQVLVDFQNETKKLYDERTMLNREIKNLQGQLSTGQVPEDTPDQLIDIQLLLKFQVEAQEVINSLQDISRKIDAGQHDLEDISEKAKATEAELKIVPERYAVALGEAESGRQKQELQAAQDYNESVQIAKQNYEASVELANKVLRQKEIAAREDYERVVAEAAQTQFDEQLRLKEQLTNYQVGMEAISAALVELHRRYEINSPPPQPETYSEKIKEAEGINDLVRLKLERKKLEDAKKAKEMLVEQLTLGLEELRLNQEAAISGASLPIEGLGFDDTGVTYKGVPFVQCSSAEQLRVSLAIAMALNPRIRVLRITDGSLLDSNNLAIIREMLKDHDYQLWLEKVSDNGGVGIVIEDGTVKSARPCNLDVCQSDGDCGACDAATP